MSINLLNRIVEGRCDRYKDKYSDKNECNVLESSRMGTVGEWFEFTSQYKCMGKTGLVEPKFTVAYYDNFENSIGFNKKEFKIVFSDYFGYGVEQTLYNVDGKGLIIFLVGRENSRDARD